MQDKSDQNGVSIIVPAFNEEEAIVDVLTEIKAAMSQIMITYEIMVVDDCSTDRTAELAKGESISLVCQSTNKGYGAAIKTGIRHTRYDSVVIIDADGTYPGRRVVDLIKEFLDGSYDMVVGARIGKNIKIPLMRKPAKWIINKLANYISGSKIPDLNSGLRVMKRSVIEKFIQILPDGFSFTSTITLAMLTNGLSIKYVPIEYFKRKGKSKIRPINDTLNFIQLVIRTVLYFDPLRVFIPLSIILTVFAFVVLLGSWFLLEKAMDVTFGVILMTAVIVIAIGMLADLIDKRIRMR